LALPTDFRELRSMFIDGNPNQSITQVSPKRLFDSDLVNQPGVPKLVAITDGQFVFAPPTDGTRTIEIIYSAGIPSLLSNATNWILDFHPDLYLRACQREADIFDVDDPRAIRLNQLIEDTISEINDNDDKEKYGSGPLIQRPAVIDGIGLRFRGRRR